MSRASILVALRQRANNVWACDGEVVTRAVAAGLRDREARTLLNSAAADADAAQAMAVTPNEAAVLALLPPASPASAPTLEGTLAQPSIAKLVGSIATALRCTLDEQEQRRRWMLPTVRLAAVAAVYSEGTLARLHALLGNVVSSDERRIEDLIEDADGEPAWLDVSECVAALAAAQSDSVYS
jgi:hypothetical protein